MLSIGNLFEGKVTEHLKRNWGKYAVGAGVAALAEPELSFHYHKSALKSLANDIASGDTNFEEKLRKAGKMLHHAGKLESANERNLLNHRELIWTKPVPKTNV
jgi:hypothetical protein